MSWGSNGCLVLIGGVNLLIRSRLSKLGIRSRCIYILMYVGIAEVGKRLAGEVDFTGL